MKIFGPGTGGREYTPAMNKTEPGQSVFAAIKSIESGHWRVGNSLLGKMLGQISNSLAKPEGWIRIETDTGRNGRVDTIFLWTSGRDHHDPSTGPALGLAIDDKDQLIQVSVGQDGRMEHAWQRKRDRVGSKGYQMGLDIARAVESAILRQRRARLIEPA